MHITVACAQLAPHKAEVEINLKRIAETIDQARVEKVDLAVFSEAATTGYFLEGGVLECALTVEELASKLGSQLKASGEIDVLVGFYEKHVGELYNSAAYLNVQGGSVNVVHVYRKFFLPTYGVFDENRFVAQGKQLGVFETRFGKVGVLICEDIWHSVMPSLAALAGAELLLVPSASPGRGFSGETVENLDRYVRLMRAISEEHGVFCLNCQLCGFEGGKGLVGGSSVIDPFGNVVAQSPILDEHLLVAEINTDSITLARAQSPLLNDLQGAWAQIKQLASSID